MLHHLRLPIVAALVATSAPATAEPNAWNDWVRDNSPNGKVVTSDGTIWINLYQPGLRDDYSVRAGDLRNARETKDRYPKYWLRGYHLKNIDVKYRETKWLVQLDCKGEKDRTLFSIAYDAAGVTLSQYGEDQTFRVIIPGTYGAELLRLFCLVPK